MEFHHLRYFVEIVECQSYTKAAEQLFITQPTLTRAIHQLESELDTQLLVRRGKYFNLTDTGKILYKSAIDLLKQYDDLNQKFSDVKNVRRGEVVIDIPGVLLSLYFTDILASFHEKFPGVSLIIREEDTLTAERDLLEDKVDLAVISTPVASKGLEGTPILHDRCQLLMHRNHAFANLKELPVNYLCNEKIVTFGRDSKMHMLFTDRCQEAGFEPNMICCTSDMSLILKMVEKEHCLAILPSRMIRMHHVSQHRVAAILPEIAWETAIAWKKGRYRSYASVKMADYLATYLDNIHD